LSLLLKKELFVGIRVIDEKKIFITKFIVFCVKKSKKNGFFREINAGAKLHSLFQNPIQKPTTF